MGWTAVKVPGGKPAIAGLGPYREAPPATGASALVRPWRSTTTGSIWFLTLFAVAWNGGVFKLMMDMGASNSVMVNEQHYASWSEALRHDPWIALFLAIFPLLGIATAYVVVAIWVNRTRIDVDANTLSIRRGPLPWRGGRLITVATSTLEQLYVEEYVSHEENDRPAKAFRVRAQLTDRRDILIDRGMRNYDHARALEQWLEARLQIVDQPVAGEVPRTRSSAP